VALLQAAPTAALGKELEDRKWLEVRTENFAIRSLLNKKETLELALHLEIFRAAASILIGVDLAESPVRAEIFAISGIRATQDFGVGQTSGGSFRTDLRSSWIVIRDINGERETDIALHHYVHFLLENFGGSTYPLWFREGMAEYLGAVWIRSDDVVIGGVPDSAVLMLHKRIWMHMQRVVARQADDAWAEINDRVFLGESWALLHFLLNAPEHATLLGKNLSPYSRQVNAGANPVESFEEHFGASVNELDRSVWEYIKNDRAPGVSISIDELLPEFDPVVTRLSRERISLELGEYALIQENLVQAHKWFQIAAGDETSRSRAEAGLGKILLAQGDFEQALPHFERALALAPDNPYAHLDAGRFWLTRAEQPAVQDAMIERAKAHFLAARDLDASLVEFYALYGQTLLLDGSDNEQAVIMLEEAQRLLAENGDIKLALAEAYAVVGRHDEAEKLTADLHRNVAEEAVATSLHKLLESTRLAD
jgi:tetratricopeptide (TPR) repeat protein